MKRLLLLAALLAACGPGSPGGPTISGRISEPEPSSRVVSTEILNREPRANTTRVKHILIGWRDLEANYAGGMDARAKARTKRDAEDEVEKLLGELKAGADFDAMVQEHSEDSGRKSQPEGYVVTPDAGLVLEFRRLGLRLEVDEVGVVETGYGFHIMKRVE